MKDATLTNLLGKLSSDLCTLVHLGGIPILAQYRHFDLTFQPYYILIMNILC